MQGNDDAKYGSVGEHVQQYDIKYLRSAECDTLKEVMKNLCEVRMIKCDIAKWDSAWGQSENHVIKPSDESGECDEAKSNSQKKFMQSKDDTAEHRPPQC